jgi:hypothetical protein
MVSMARFLKIIDIRGGQKPAARYFSEESTKRTPGKNEGIDMLRAPLGASFFGWTGHFADNSFIVFIGLLSQ